MKLPEFQSGCRRAAWWLLSSVALMLAGTHCGAAPEVADSAQAEIATLRAEIARHDDLYFKQAKSEISDWAYDQLKRRLQFLERAHPDLAVPDQAVGDDRRGRFPTYVHRERMLSLHKIYSEAAWRDFHAKLTRQLGRSDLQFIVEPKYDGLAISLTYERGVLVRAVTRGNGSEGDMVTANVRAIPGVPSKLRTDGMVAPDRVELRGEVYFTNAEFHRINTAREALGAEPFAHPRNLAAGTLKSADPVEHAGRKLSIVIFGWGAWEGSAPPATQQALHSQVEAWGLPGVERYKVVRTADEAWSAIRALGQERRMLGFPTDGVVVKLDETVLRNQVGTDDDGPRWAVAYKFGPELAVTQLRSIVWQVGRTGVLTPVAAFDPVELDGTTVSRATLHNGSEIQRRDIRIGDLIEVVKSGEVIPAIAGVILPRRAADTPKYKLPDICPSCGTTVESNPEEVALRCPNPQCPAQRQRRLEHFVSSQAVDIKGFGPATIAALLEAGLLNSPSDFYRLRGDDLARIDGIGAKTAERLKAEIERSKRAELWRFIYGLNIPRVGVVTAKELAASCGDLATLTRSGERAVWKSLDPAVAASVGLFMSRSENQAEIGLLLGAGVRPTTAVAVKATSLKGKIFVFTGTLPELNRAQAVEWVLASGGSVRESVSRKTDYVVAGKGAGAKQTEAQTLGVRVINEVEFRRLVGME